MEKIVLKIGTGVLATDSPMAPFENIEKIIDATVPHLDSEKQQLVIVSSGAVGIGKKILKINKAETLTQKQVCASLGQAHLIETYQKALAKYDYTAAQILITSRDLKAASTRQNLISCLEAMESSPIVPIVNENDVLSTEEIETSTEENSFGDNDQLSSLLSVRIRADLLVILTTNTGVFLKKPKSEDERPMTFISDLSEFNEVEVWQNSKQGRGGIHSKLNSIKYAAKNGLSSWTCSGHDFPALFDFFRDLSAKTAPLTGTFVFGKDSQWKTNSSK